MTMPPLLVSPVVSSAERRRFLELPWRLHRSDPHWIPPLRRNQEELVGFRRHPFQDDADLQAFLATRGGEPVGRIVAIVNHAHNRRYAEQRGFFGFFETVDDPEVAAGLFEHAEGWLRERGMNAVRGPTNPSLNYECGLLVEGFDSAPTFMMTYNPPYYERLVEAAGYRPVQDLYAFWGHVDMLEQRDEKIAFISEEARRRFDVKIRRLDTRHFRDDVRLFLRIYNESLGGTWGFVPLSAAEVDYLSGGLRHLIVPSMTAVAEVEGRPVGAVFGLLDYNPLIKRIDGRLFPFGFLRLRLGRRKLSRIRLISTNVLPEFQRWGLGLVLTHSLLEDGLAWGLKEVEFSWVLESNHLSRKTLERAGAKRTKTYRLYDKSLETTRLH